MHLEKKGEEPAKKDEVVVENPKEIDLGLTKTPKRGVDKLEEKKEREKSVRSTKPIKLSWEKVEFEVEVPVKSEELRGNGIKSMK